MIRQEFRKQHSQSGHSILTQKREWDKRIELSKTNFIKHLNAVDVLDSDALKGMVDAFEQEIRFNCKAFISEQQLNCAKSLDADAPDTLLNSQDCSNITDYLVGGALAATAAILANAITISSTSWLFFTTTTAVSGVVGGALGISSGIATLGIGAGAGVAGGVAINRLLKKRRTRTVRSTILREFDEKVMPGLRKWGYDIIERVHS